MQERRIIAIDFDGVLCKNLTSWAGHAVISDGPNDGAIYWFRGLLIDSRFEVFIHSLRCNKPEGVAAIMAWLVQNGIEKQLVDLVTFARQKPPAAVFLDDRAIQFRGDFPTYNELAKFVPWSPKSSAQGRRNLGDVNYSDTASEGEAEAIWRDEHRCLTCLHAPLCVVALATKQTGMLSAITRCVGHTESYLPEID